MATDVTRPSTLRIYAWTLLLNGAIGFALTTASAILTYPCVAAYHVAFGLSVTASGIVFGLFVLRGCLWAHIGGLLFYAIQIVRYQSASFTWAIYCGINFDIRFLSKDRFFSINLLGAMFLLLGLFTTLQHLKLLREKTGDEMRHQDASPRG